MSNLLQPMSFVPEGVVDLNDVPAAVAAALGLSGGDGEPTLLGADALRLAVESDALWIERLVVRSRRGWRWNLRDVRLAWPACNDGATRLRLAINWGLAPVADGSAFQVPVARTRWLRDGEAGDDGELVIGSYVAGEVELVPVAADRADAAPANLAWWRSTREELTNVASQLYRVDARFVRLAAPPFWSSMLTDAHASLAAALRQAAQASLEHLVGVAEQAIAALRQVPGLAQLAGALPLVQLLADLNVPEVAPERGVEDRCTAISRALEQLSRALGQVLETCGDLVERLPRRLCRGGTIFQLQRRLTVTSSRAGGRSNHRVAEPRDPKLPCVVLWRASRRVLLGDVCATVAAGQGAARYQRLLDKFDGTGHHWLDDVPPGALDLEAPADVQLIEVALYEPVEGS